MLVVVKHVIALTLCAAVLWQWALQSVHVPVNAVLQKMLTSPRTSAGSDRDKDPLFLSEGWDKLSKDIRQLLLSLLACPAKDRPLLSQLVHHRWLRSDGMNMA